MKNKYPNEKLDLFYTIGWLLFTFIILLAMKFIPLENEWLSSLFFIFALTVPSLIRNRRRNKQIKKIDAIRKELNLSLEAIRALGNIGQYDLIDWQWKKAHVSQKKLYQLEDVLEKKYVQAFGKGFEA